MQRAKWVYLIRSVIAVLLVALGVVSLTSGRVVVGVLLCGLAAMNVALTVAMRRRRADLLARYPGLAGRAARSG
jgi:hypothetical protein